MGLIHRTSCAAWAPTRPTHALPSCAKRATRSSPILWTPLTAMATEGAWRSISWRVSHASYQRTQKKCAWNHNSSYQGAQSYKARFYRTSSTKCHRHRGNTHCSTTTTGFGLHYLQAERLGASKHQIRRGCSPHRQAGFCHAQFLGAGASAPTLHGFG